MAIRNWSTLTNGQVIAFNPATDVLRFDSTSISAGLGSSSSTHLDAWIEPGNITMFYYGGKEVTLNASIKTLWSGNVTFANGGKFLFGNNAASTAADDSNNTLTGTAQSDRLIGAGGNDRLIGLGGNDYFPMLGHSTSGAYGNDTLDGGTGTDQVGFEDAASAINCNLATGRSTGGGAGTIKLIAIENVGGSGYNDIITGSPSANLLYGNEGNDRLTGNGGNDRLWGYTGTDMLSGGNGNDILYWDSADFLNGGPGDDRLAVGASALNLGAVPNTKIVDIEEIDLDGDFNLGNFGVFLTVTTTEVLAASTTTNTLKVFGSAGDTVKATGFTQMADVMIGVTQFNQYKSGSAILLVEDSVGPILGPMVII